METDFLTSMTDDELFNMLADWIEESNTTSKASYQRWASQHNMPSAKSILEQLDMQWWKIVNEAVDRIPTNA